MPHHISSSNKAKKPFNPSLTVDHIAKYCHLSINEASVILNSTVSHLRVECRRLGLVRWPYRKSTWVTSTSDQRAKQFDFLLVSKQQEPCKYAVNSDSNHSPSSSTTTMNSKSTTTMTLGHQSGHHCDKFDEEHHQPNDGKIPVQQSSVSELCILPSFNDLMVQLGLAK